MWTPFVYDHNCYMADIDSSDESLIKIYVTDFKSIWAQELSGQEFIENFKILNPLIEPKINQIMPKLIQILIKNECTVICNKESMVLNVQAKSDEYALNYKFVLSSGCSELFFNKVTLSLMRSIHHLKVQTEMLCTVLEAKDKEIEQHVFENGDMKRNDLKTGKFDGQKVIEESNKISILNVLTKSKEYNDDLFKSLGIDNKSALSKISGLTKIKKKKIITLRRHKSKKIG